MTQTIDPNESAYPTVSRDGNWQPHHDGMTIRATMAMHLMGGLLANAGGPIQANGMSGWGFVNCNPDQVAQVAAACADALIAELNRTTS